MTERILVEGVGSVGGLLAGELLHHGHALTLVTGNVAITDAIRARGLAIETPEQRYTVAAEAYTALDELPRDARFDSAWLLMMAGAVEDAARATLPWLTRDGSLVSFQNGMVGERIAALCGAERVVNVSVVFGAVMTAPGCYTRNTRGALFIGQPGVHEPTPRLAALKALLDVAAPTTISANIEGVLWAKLAWNCAVSGLCAVANTVLGELVVTPSGQEAFLGVYREALDTAHAYGIHEERIVIDHARFYLPRDAGPVTRAACRDAVAGLVERYGAVLPSALQSLRRGRRTEIPYLNGYLADKAAAIGRPAPLNARIAKMIEEIESGQRAMGPANIEALLP
ncbi:MAG: 2-dehydropantoate 2-reductase [Proteobacteria bacterium]|nr:2-dehydropantoate 2-reductase [Pseudomonadota bacterium]